MTRRFSFIPAFIPAMAAALLCTISGTAHAAAEAQNSSSGSVMITPATEWKVGPIAAKSDTGASYCSMKSSYRSGQMIVFARDSMGENSIAVDFKRDAYTVGQQYNVLLKSGAIKRRLIGLAATPQIIVLQTGVDTVLYTALHNKHMMNLEIDQNKYSFDLDVSAADALVALGHCSDSLQLGSKPFQEITFTLGKTQEDKLPEQADDEIADSSSAADMADEPAPKKSRGKHSKTARASSKSASELERLRAENAALMTENEKARIALRNQAEINSDVQAELTRGSSAPASMKPSAASTASLKSLIVASNIVQPDAIRAPDSRNTLRWESNDIFGSAQTLPMASGKTIDDMAQSYIRQLGSLCKGDFAHNMRNVSGSVIEAEVSCIDGKNDAAAAILFMNSNGKFSVITQEGTTDQLDAAMANRDSIVSAAGVN